MTRKPGILLSLLPITALVILLIITVSVFNNNALSGASQIVLLVATALCCVISVGYLKVSWKTLEHAMVNNIDSVAPSILILLMIGAVAGTWMVSGVVPTLIYYGMQIIHPSFFLASTCVICAIVSLMTGSSWTTIATIGIALLGIGKVQGFSEGWIAGAIISGAYFGDKMSPLSDTTVLAASVSETPLFRHIRYMLITTVPTMIITLIIFAVFGFSNEATNTAEIERFNTAVEQTFNISPWLLVVPAVTMLMIAKKIPSIVTLFVSAALALAATYIFQPELIKQIAGSEYTGAAASYAGGLKILFGSTQIESGFQDLNELIATRGMGGMLNTIWLIICAMCFGGAMTASGMLGTITSMFIRFMTNTFGTVASTVASGLLLNLTASDQYIAIILNGNMFKSIYDKDGYEDRLLSRTLEDSITVTSALIPWNTCGMTQSTILNVPTLTYLPYCFFNLISPIMTLIIAALGYKIKRIKYEKS